MRTRTRRLIIIFISMFMGIAFGVFLIKSNALALDVNPYVKVGGMELIEKNISEGHKAYGLVGVDFIKKMAKNEFTFTAEAFTMVEAVDEDPELLHNGFKVGGQTKMLIGSVEPFIGVYYEQWNRDTNQKYPGSFTELNFVDATLGMSTERKYLYASIAGLYPVWSSEFSGELGFDASIGIKLGDFKIGYSYKRVSFSDVESNFSGAKVSYKF
jgi:hypothetical protein